MFQLLVPLRAFVICLERYELNQILEKVAKANRYANPEIFILDKYEIPSLIWPPPNEKTLSILTAPETTHAMVVSRWKQ